MGAVLLAGTGKNQALSLGKGWQRKNSAQFESPQADCLAGVWAVGARALDTFE